MNEKERNRREWENPENWRGPFRASFYFGECDTRAFVPRRRPRGGYTINLGGTAGRWVMASILAVVILVAVLALAFGS